MTVSRDFIVGLIVIIAFGLLILITASLRQWDFLSQRDTYLVEFPQLAMLDIGAPVLLAGIQVGTVGRMDYTDNPRYPVLVTIRVRKNIRLFSNATVQVVPAPVIGSTTVNIDGGHPGPGVHLLQPGATLIGQMPPQLQEILSSTSLQINQVSTELIDVLKGMGAFINDPANQAKIRETLANVAAATGKANQTLEMVNNEFLPLVTSLKSASQRLDNFLKEASSLSTQLTATVNQTGESLQRTAGDFSNAAQTLNAEIKTNGDRLKTTLNQLDSTVAANKEPLTRSIAELGQAARSLHDVLELAKNGQGTLGKLLTDPRPFEQLRQILATLSATLTGQQESIFPTEPPNAKSRPRSIFPTNEPQAQPAPKGARPSIAPEGGPAQ